MTEARYQAFLSYSHADRKIAQWLHHALETYRVPGRLVGRATPVGKVGERLGRIFKDREELPASGNLGAEIEAALQASSALIVICSMAAARSKWVNEEVRNFKRLHGAARVFALIVDGEPYTSAIAGREAEECFPTALRFVVDDAGAVTATRAEPIAADLRPQGDGRRLAVLKLIAGLTGLPLDDLAQREAQRRAKRATQIAMAASVLAVAMAGLAVVAVRARDDARQQRTQAEGLIEFMLVDLRKKLEPVGRLDVLDAVGEKALAHYNAQEGRQLDANSLGHRSRALHLIGEVRQNRGKLSEALAAFERAAETTAELLQRAPDDPQRIFDHAQSVFWVGAVARQRGEPERTERAFEQYRDLAAKLLAREPDKRDWQIEAGFAAYNLGIALLDRARPADAIVLLEEARRRMLPHVAAQPELAFEIGHTLGWLSLAHERLGAYDKAIEFQEQKQAQFKSIPDAARNQQAQRGLQNAEYEIGRLELQRGRLEAAAARLGTAVAMADTMVARDRANLYWLGESVLARLHHAQAQLALGDRPAARVSLGQARTAIARLLTSDSTDMAWSVAFDGLALALSAELVEEAPGTVSDELTAYVARVDALQKNGKTIKPSQLAHSAFAQLQLGKLLRNHSRGELAARHFAVVVERLAPLETTSDFAALTLLGRASLAAGERDRAARLLQRIEASAYRHPYHAEFVKEMSRGTGPAPSPNQGSAS